jgi:hypothetical protein
MPNLMIAKCLISNGSGTPKAAVACPDIVTAGMWSGTDVAALAKLLVMA